MTSTSFNVGLTDGRASSRVLNPPGGQHTDIFGAETEAPRYGRRQASQILQNTQAEAAKNNGAPVDNGEAKVEAAEPSAEAPAPVEDRPAPATEKAAPPGAAAAAAPAAKNPQPEAPKRVRVPPGGFSSKLW